MNNRQIQFAYRVRHALDANLENLPASTTERLASARQIALSRKKSDAPLTALAPQLRPALAGVGQGGMGGFFGASGFSWLGRVGIAIPLLAGVLLFVGLYQHEYRQRIDALAEIDTGVLSDELPLSAYLDHGFNAYLSKQQGQ